MEQSEEKKFEDYYKNHFKDELKNVVRILELRKESYIKDTDTRNEIQNTIDMLNAKWYKRNEEGIDTRLKNIIDCLESRQMKKIKNANIYCELQTAIDLLNTKYNEVLIEKLEKNKYIVNIILENNNITSVKETDIIEAMKQYIKFRSIEIKLSDRLHKNIQNDLNKDINVINFIEYAINKLQKTENDKVHVFTGNTDLKKYLSLIDDMQLENKGIIYSAKQNTFGYANLKDIYYEGKDLFIGEAKEVIKMLEYRLNMHEDMVKDSKNRLLIDKDVTDYLKSIKTNINTLNSLPSDELVLLDEDNNLVVGINLYKLLKTIYERERERLGQNLIEEEQDEGAI